MIIDEHREVNYSASNKKNALGDSFCLKIPGVTSFFPMHHSWPAIDELDPGDLVDLEPAGDNNVPQASS